MATNCGCEECNFCDLKLISPKKSLLISKGNNCIFKLDLNGEFVNPFFSLDSSSINFSGAGTSGSPLTAAVKISATLGNGASILPDGLYINTSGLLYTDEQAQDAVGGILNNAEFTYSDGTPSISINQIPWAKIINVPYTVKVSANDSTPGYLNGKLVQGSGMLLVETNDGANETFVVNHADTSSVANINTSGLQVIDEITYDTFGHVVTTTLRTITQQELVDTTKQVHIAGATVTMNDNTRALYINPAANLAALTITMPAIPYDAQEVLISFGGTVTAGSVVTALTLVGNAGQSILTNTVISSAVAGDSYILKWEASTNLWRIF